MSKSLNIFHAFKMPSELALMTVSVFSMSVSLSVQYGSCASMGRTLHPLSLNLCPGMQPNVGTHLENIVATRRNSSNFTILFNQLINKSINQSCYVNNVFGRVITATVFGGRRAMRSKTPDSHT